MILSSHLLHDLERVCDHVILLAASRTQLCDDIDDVLASHRMLVGPRGPVSDIEPSVHVDQGHPDGRPDPAGGPPRRAGARSVLGGRARWGWKTIILAYMGHDAPAPGGALSGDREERTMNQLVWRLHRNQVVLRRRRIGCPGRCSWWSRASHGPRLPRASWPPVPPPRAVATDRVSCSSGDGAIFDVVNLTMVVPLLFGLFWGAPLVAKEFEDGTHNLAWTQGVTRRHWLRTNVLGPAGRRGVGGGDCRTGQLVAQPGERPRAAGSTPSTSKGSCPWPTRSSPWPSASPSGRCSGGCCRPWPRRSGPSWRSGWPSGSISGPT